MDVCYGKDYKHLNEGNFPVLGTGGVMGYVDEYLYSGESILIGRKGTIDKPKYINGPFWTVDTLFFTKIKEGNPKFIFYQLNKINWLKYNEASGVPSLSANNIKNIKIKIPSLEEQKKIASFLSAVDKKIELLEKKYKNSLNLKNSIFENLLNRTYSFKNSSKNWEEIKLSSILKERKEFADKKSNYPHVTLSKEGILPKTEEYNRDFLVKDENKKYKVTHLNDICYNPANLKFGVITLNKFGSAIFSPIYVTFEVKNANTEFVAYNLIRSNFINKIRKYEEGTVYERMAVKPSDFLKGNILLPPLEEQEKISHILNNLNKQLILIQKEQELITSFKKSLLQKMFI